MKTLLFDAGNTRLKWQVWELSPEYRRGLSSGFIDNNEDWEQVLPALLDNVGRLDLVGISIVSGDQRLEKIQSCVRMSQDVPVYKAETRQGLTGVVVAYDQPQTIGVDRWLALLAAHDIEVPETKVVVDCGTAITIDVINASGNHLGGYIVPGISLMKRTLASNTAKLTFKEELDPDTSLGNTTAHCIDHGVLSMAVALIDKVVNEHTDSLVILTGGDAPQVERLIDTYKERRVVLEPNLIMDGLVIAAREDRKVCVG